MNYKLYVLAIVLLGGISVAHAQQNQLSDQQKAEGWQLLFNGQDLRGWMKADGTAPPAVWQVQEGVLIKTDSAGSAGDIITKETFEDFELIVDFKLSEGGNSGIKYFYAPYADGGWLGPEFQILDDQRHPDAKMGRQGNRQQGALYDLLPVEKQTPGRVGEWNQARIRARGDRVEHYLNGTKVLDYKRSSKRFEEARKASKFKDVQPPFGSITQGHILLQDHGDMVQFRNIKIRRL